MIDLSNGSSLKDAFEFGVTEITRELASVIPKRFRVDHEQRIDIGWLKVQCVESLTQSRPSDLASLTNWSNCWSLAIRWWR